jgi:flagellar assembly protein FliH
MPDIPTIKLTRTIGSINIIENRTAVMEPAGAEYVLDGDTDIGLQSNKETKKQEQYDKAFEAIESAARKIQIVYERMIIEHRQAIAKLATEIARKILSQKIQDGDYQIESIVQEALNNAPARQNIIVRLNPQDLTKCQQMQQGNSIFESVKLVADAAVGRAECIVETPKGKVESLIEGHLEQVARALGKAV